MAQVQAVCDTCRTRFNSGIEMTRSSGQFVGSKSGPCPRCGGMGTIPDGRYTEMDGILSMVQDSNLDRLVLAELRETIARELAQGNTQAAVEAATASVPGLSERFAPKNATELTGYLVLLLAVISMLIALKTEGPQSPQVNITNVINDVSQVVHPTDDPR